MPIFISSFNTPFGELILGSVDDCLCLCDWKYRKQRIAIDHRIQSSIGSEYVEKETDVIIQTKNQLDEYFRKERKEFSIPLLLLGTDFQKIVWNQLMKISYGESISYLQLAQQMSNPLAIRAIASANGANAISIIVPCHRIIGSKGDLVGYAGGLEAKRKLLELENCSKQISMF